MSHYKPKSIRWLKVTASIIRGISGMLSRWPLLLVAIFVISPIGPHLRFQYTYEQHGSYRHMLHCEYLGSRGFVQYPTRGNCPIILILDRRKMSGG